MPGAVLAVLHAEYSRWQTHKPMEISGKMALVGKSRFQCDVSHGDIRFRKQVLRQRESAAHDVRLRCYSK
jgi:hypothetical protein